ncbi:MAG: type II toxin-antitoxin system death-on-curing family toxin [Hyphomicrobiaceae bacterium]
MNEPEWLSVQDIIDLHAAQLAIFGGPEGLRDAGLLESAVARPINRWNYGERDIAVLAAVYATGISQNHPFVDGNKRAAFAALIVFLDVNGFELDVDPAEAAAAILALAAGEMDEEGLTRWIRDNWPDT